MRLSGGARIGWFQTTFGYADLNVQMVRLHALGKQETIYKTEGGCVLRSHSRFFAASYQLVYKDLSVGEIRFQPHIGAFEFEQLVVANGWVLVEQGEGT